MKQIYFIKPVGMDGPIKIGCSKLPEKRLVQLSQWSPFELEIIALGEGPHELERFLHRTFSESRSHKEWFHPTPDMMARIRLVRSGMSIVDAFEAVAYLPKNSQTKYRQAKPNQPVPQGEAA